MADKQATQYHTLGTPVIEESEAEEFWMFKVSLGYIANSRPATPAYWNFVNELIAT